MKKTVIAFVLALTMTAGLVQPVMATETTTTKDKRTTTWDLSSFYSDDAAINADIVQLLDYSKQIYSYKGKLNNVENIVKVYGFLNKAEEISYKLYAYQNLLEYSDMDNDSISDLSEKTKNAIYEFENETAYMNSEIVANSDAVLDKVQSDSRMSGNKVRFTRLRENKANVLNEHDTNMVKNLEDSANGAIDTYETLRYGDLPTKDITFPDGEVLKADDDNFAALISQGCDQPFRVKYAESVFEPFEEMEDTFAATYNNYCNGISDIAKTYGYSSTLEYSLAMDDVDLEIYQNIMKASVESEDALKDYTNLLKDELNLDNIYFIDFNVPMEAVPDKKYTYDEACDIILKSVEPLGEQYVKDAGTILDSGVIDVYPREDKSSWTFTENYYNNSPYIMTNFDGSYNGIVLLAGALGKAMNMLYGDTAQSTLYEAYPNYLMTEISTSVSHILLYDYMINNAKNTDEKKYFISAELTYLYNMYYIESKYQYFQETSTTALENGESLTADKLNQLWENSNKAYFGDSVSMVNNSEVGWARIPYFYQGFYRYKYVVAAAAASDIAKRVEEGTTGANAGYVNFLLSGDTMSAKDTLMLAGIDSSETTFKQGFTDRFEALINEYKSLK